MKPTLALMAGLLIGWFLGKTSEGTLITPAQAQPVGTKKPADTDARMMETVGLVTTLYLYQTYLNVGLLADCRAEGVYEDKQVKDLLASSLQPLTVVEKQMQEIVKNAGTKAERDSLAKMLKIVSPLRRQGQELQKFWETEKESHAKGYEAARKESWQNLSSLLGLNEDADKKK